MSEEKMGYEIDFLPVGSGEKSGDAIAVRYGFPGKYIIMIIDGVTKDSGESLVHHIKTKYNTTHVHYVVNTHPDGDHASGLSVVLEQLSVGELWMHRPWLYSAEIREYFKDKRITDKSLAERLQAKMGAAYKLEELATKLQIPIFEPYEGHTIGLFTVLGPNIEYYLNLTPQFAKSPEAKPIIHENASVLKSLFGSAQTILESVKNYFDETWDIETLGENSKTSAENNSSVILYGFISGKGILFTGDSGVESLNRAIDFAETQGIDLKQCSFLQVPHHGSRHNVSPSMLDRLIGKKVTYNMTPNKTAFVSASKDSTTHPRKVVMNAFKRRGVQVYKQNGLIIWHHRNMPVRPTFGQIEPLEFFQKVES